MLSLVHSTCRISPIDSTLTYPNGRISSSSLGQLFRFFFCAKNASEMPADAPSFLAFLKTSAFPVENLCTVLVDSDD